MEEINYELAGQFPLIGVEVATVELEPEIFLQVAGRDAGRFELLNQVQHFLHFLGFYVEAVGKGDVVGDDVTLPAQKTVFIQRIEDKDSDELLPFVEIEEVNLLFQLIPE